MPDRILLNPENRALASSGSNDFSLYGAQPNAAVSLRPAPSSSDIGEAPANSGSAVAPPSADPPGARADESAEHVEAESFGANSTPGRPAPGHVTSAEAVSEGSAGTGSIIPLQFAAAAFQDNSALTLAAKLPETQPAASQPPASTGDGAAGQVSSSNVRAVDDKAGESFEGFNLTAPDLPFGGVSLAAAEASATPGLSSLNLDVEPAEALPSALAEASEGLTDAGSGVFAALGEVDAAAGGAVDDVQDLLGTDPVAGIATLVSLVTVSDVLPVSEAGNEEGDAAEAAGSDMLDALAADTASESNLLGTDADDASAAASVTSPAPPTGGLDPLGGLG